MRKRNEEKDAYGSDVNLELRLGDEVEGPNGHKAGNLICQAVLKNSNGYIDVGANLVAEERNNVTHALNGGLLDLLVNVLLLQLLQTAQNLIRTGGGRPEERSYLIGKNDFKELKKRKHPS